MPNILFTGQSIIGKSRVYTPDENGHVEGEMYETKNDELGGEWSYTNSILIDNRYLYVATRFGIEVIDTQADEVVKLLGHHKPDQSTIENTQLPTDTLTTFQYNGDTYAIGADHIIYKVTGAKKMDIKDKYITITPETQVTGSVLNFMENTERIVQMQKI